MCNADEVNLKKSVYAARGVPARGGVDGFSVDELRAFPERLAWGTVELNKAMDALSADELVLLRLALDGLSARVYELGLRKKSIRP